MNSSDYQVHFQIPPNVQAINFHFQVQHQEQNENIYEQNRAFQQQNKELQQKLADTEHLYQREHNLHQYYEEKKNKWKSDYYSLLEQQYSANATMEQCQWQISRQTKEISKNTKMMEEYQQKISHQERLLKKCKNLNLAERNLNLQNEVDSYESIFFDISQMADKGDIKGIQNKIDAYWDDYLSLE